MALTPVPVSVAMTVGTWIDLKRDMAREYNNLQFVMDASMVTELHRLAADIYAAGWNDGHAVGREESRGGQVASRPAG